MVQPISVDQQLITSGDFISSHLLCSSYICIFHLFASMFKRRRHQPSIFIHKYLMNADFMALATVLKAGVIHQISPPVFSIDNTIVSLCALAPITFCLVTPFAIRTQDIHTATIAIGTIVHHIFVIYSTRSIRINVWPVRILRAEHTHLVAPFCLKSSIRDEKVIIVADMLNIAGLA